MIIDANLLLYAVDADASRHAVAATWWRDTLDKPRRIGLPWQTIGAFLRISTHSRVYADPLSAAQAWGFVSEWLALPNVWIPPVSERTAQVLGELLASTGASGNLVPDAQLAALAIENGVTVFSTDGDFARFPDCRWENPLG
ncbi:MAG: TA system VapC family ribonuclease toxin [Candidatus Nanopelagicales bacterium]|nr:TA system VapC family ribonuclease toxin [Candidatus Nanopelagicales bacterium]